MNSTEQTSLQLNYIKGCLIGALMGDSLGYVFEKFGYRGVGEVNFFFKTMNDPETQNREIVYSDDTAMTHCITESLIENKRFHLADMSKKMATKYFNETKDRYYGGGMRVLFNKFRKSNYKDIYKISSEQFSGTGSFGNGGGMRISPVCIFYHSNYERMLEVAKKVTMITHTHELGINGALLQAISVHQSLHYDRSKPFDPFEFLTQVKNKMKKIERPDADPSYVKKLEHLELLLKNENTNISDVVRTLGNGVKAYMSIPTALYIFLRSFKPIPDVQSDNVVTRCINYSILLKGDTDTIATMSAAIAGAYFGYDYIDTRPLRFIERNKYTIDLAERLYRTAEQVGDLSNVHDD